MQRLDAQPVVKEEGFYKKLCTVSNLLTMSRVMATPFIVRGVWLSDWKFVTILFVAAALTDFFDGFCARLLHEVSAIGTLLDPVADKVFLAGCFGALAWTPFLSDIIPSWFLISLLVREMLLLAGSAVLMSQGLMASLQPTWLGKLSTFLHMVCITGLLMGEWFNCRGWVTSWSTIFVVLWVLLVVSCSDYVIRGLTGLWGRRAA